MHVFERLQSFYEEFNRFALDNRIPKIKYQLESQSILSFLKKTQLQIFRCF